MYSNIDTREYRLCGNCSYRMRDLMENIGKGPAPGMSYGVLRVQRTSFTNKVPLWVLQDAISF